MKFRRYYLKGASYDRVMSEEQFQALISSHGLEYAMEEDTAHYDIKFDSDEEMIEYFNESCLRVMNDTKWYLNNLDKVPTFDIRNSKVFKGRDRSI